MDKLKPVLEQKFWIFFGLVFIMPLVGYFMTKGPLAAEIETRWKALDGVFGGVPAGTGSPNELWAKNAKDINAQCELNNKNAHLALWKSQEAVMRFPARIEADMKKVGYFKPVELRGDKIQQKYGEDYPEELRTLWLIVDPLDDGKNFRESSARRKVAFTMSDMHQANWGTWGEAGPDFPKIWAAQEDIWLETELLNAIKRINQPCNSQHEAYIKQILKVVFFGGVKASGDAGAAAQPTNSGGAGGMEGTMSAFGGFGGPGGGPASGTGGKGVGLVEVSLAEEFTPSIEVGGGPAAAAGPGNLSSFESPSSSSSPAGGAGGIAAQGGGGPAKTEIKRYIDDDEKLPYKRRGFSITLVMDHRQVPHLLAELMNSPFPVEIVRVHQGIYAEGASPSGGAQGGFAATGGFPGGSAGSGLFKGPSTDGAGSFSATEDSLSPAVTSGSGPGSGRPAGSSTVSAMADPNLAAVAIVGVWTLYRPPVIDPNQAPATSPTPANPNLAGNNPTAPTSPAADLNTSENPTTAATDKPSDAEKPTAESTGADDAAPPKTPANPDDKPDSEEKTPADKPAQSKDETPETSKKNDDKDE